MFIVVARRPTHTYAEYDGACDGAIMSDGERGGNEGINGQVRVRTPFWLQACITRADSVDNSPEDDEICCKKWSRCQDGRRYSMDG